MTRRTESAHLALEEVLIDTFNAAIGRVPEPGGVPAIRRILAPTDFSPSSLAALPYAEEMARRFDAELLLLYVDFAPSIYDPSQDETASKAAIERAAEALCGRGVLARPVYRRGAAADEIVRSAAEEHADVIVMATHGRTGLAHALMGSVAESVLRGAACPVLTVRGVAAK